MTVSNLVQIRDRSGEALDPVFFAADVACFGSDADTDAGHERAGLAELVPDDLDRLRFAVDVNGDALFAAAIYDAVSFEPVPVRREGPVPAAKRDARLGAAPDVVVADQIVRVAVA